MEAILSIEEHLLEVEAVIGTVNVSLVDINKNQSNNYSARVDSTVTESMLTLNQSKYLHMEATSAFGNVTILMKRFEGVSRELLDIIQLENQLKVSNQHQDLLKQLNELQVSRE